jgi:hypothetical protein
MIEVSMADAVLRYDNQVLEVFSRFDNDSARIHVGLIESTTIEAGVPLLTITLRGGLTRPQISFDESARGDVERLVTTMNEEGSSWRQAHGSG